MANREDHKKPIVVNRQVWNQWPGPRRVSEPIQGARNEEVIQAPLLPGVEMEPRAIPPQNVIDSTSAMVPANNQVSGRARLAIMRDILTNYRLSDQNEIVLRTNE